MNKIRRKTRKKFNSNMGNKINIENSKQHKLQNRFKIFKQMSIKVKEKFKAQS